MLSADVLRPLADLLLTLATATMLVYMMRRIRSGRRLKSNKGRDFMMAGFALVVVASFADLILRLAVPESLLLGNPALLHGIVPGWLVWVVTRLSFSLLAIGLLLAFRQRLSDEKKFRASKREATDAYAVMVQSEARFRHLYETTSDSVYCFAFDPPLPISIPLDEQVTRSHDAILTECNAVFAKVLQRESPSDVVGWRLGQLHSTLDADAHLRFFQAVVESGYNLTDYEMLYTDPGGTERALRMSVTGIVHDGFLLRYWAVETNILDLRRTKAALLRRRTFHDLLTNISSRLIMAAPSQADDEVRASIQSVCEYIEADRTSVLWIDPESMAVEIAYGWSVADIPLLSNINLTEFPKGTEKVLRGESLCINDVAELPDDWREEGKRFSELGMKSFVAVPLMADGQVVGVSTYTHLNEKRVFLDQDLADLRVISDLLANYILRLRSSRQLDSALAGLKKATERLDAENVYLREEIELTLGFDEIIGRSAAMLNCLVQVERVAVTSAPVLILGETGTGKELIARAIHEHSDRSGRPLVKVNCAALPGNLIESELFGYEKGAFTGAEKAKRGRFDLADGSSIFLDEFGDIPLELQAKLLRVLQEGEFERLGGNRTIKVDVRIIAATNKNISDAVNAGEFRSDLLYRINAFPIEVPALRERGDDIRMLTEHFVQSYSKRYGKEITAISARMMEEISEYSWPGNIRELEGVVQRALISSTTSVLGLAATLTELSKGPDGSSSHPDDATNFDLEDAERRHIVSVLTETGWKIAGVAGAATKLGIPPSTLRSKMQKLSIQRPA
jgi:transcriptional regulator with GAF, ATPase, and Fis domain